MNNWVQLNECVPGETFLKMSPFPSLSITTGFSLHFQVWPCKNPESGNYQKKILLRVNNTLLSKGLLFGPTREVNVFGQKEDLFKCSHVSNGNPTASSKLRPNMIFYLNVSRASINTFCRLVDQAITNTVKQPVHAPNNLSANERQVFKEWMNDKDIIIKS